MKDRFQFQGLNEHKDSYLAYYDSGKKLVKQRKFTEAIKAYKKAIELNPNYFWSYYNLGFAQYAVGNFTEAIQAYERAVELKPDYIWSYNNLGDVFSKQGKFDRAIDCYRRALKYELIRSMANFWAVEEKSEPNFMIIGFAKCGTTSLYEYLIQHPQILPAAKKETMFFSENFDYGIDWYQAHFPSIPEGQNFITGEASAHYIDHPHAFERVYNHFPGVKLIVLLRNPIERTYSDYQMWKMLGMENRPFEKVIVPEMDRVKGEAQATFDERTRRVCPSFLPSSLYVYSLKRWMALFPREQFLVLQTEELCADPGKVLNEVFHHLGLNEYRIQNYGKHNVGSYAPISDEMQSRLKRYFRPHNQLLEEFLGIKFNWDE